MKKTILALAVTSIFSAGAMAATVTPDYTSVSDVEKAIEAAQAAGDIEVSDIGSSDGKLFKITSTDGGKSIYVKRDANGATVVNGNKTTRYDTENGKIIRVDGKDAANDWKVDDNKHQDHLNNAVRIDDIEAAGAKYINDGKNAIDAANQRITSNQDKLDNTHTRVNSLESKGEAAYKAIERSNTLQSKRTDSLEARGQTEFAKIRQEMKDNSTFDINIDEEAEKMIRTEGEKAYNSLRDQGGREVAKLESAISGVDKGLRIDGENAYNKLRAEGGREVAKLESVSDALNKKMDLMENDGTKYVQEKADAAVEKSTKSMREEGAKSLVRMEEKGVGAVDALQAQIDELRSQIAENNNGSNGSSNNNVIEDDTNAAADAEIAKEISKEVDGRIDAASAAAYKEASEYARATDKTLADHGKRIGSLEQDMKNMGNKMLKLEDRMDGVVASSHAITNARPVLNSAGQFGMGVGMGAAGSKQAIALGGAYQITDNWSGTMSVNYETKGKVSNDQLSAGVGAQYIF